MRRSLLGCAALGLVAMTPVETQQVLDERQALMKEMRTALGGFVPMLKGDKPWDKAGVASLADRIRKDAARMIAMFPEGTDSGKVFSMALPEIWQRREEFDAAARLTGMAATRLTELAGSGDSAALAKQVEVLSITCTDCHQAFRVRR